MQQAKKLLAALLLITILPIGSQAFFFDNNCDDEDYNRPNLETFFTNEKEADIQKALDELCFKSKDETKSSKASFYGTEFHGRRTAAGEKYDNNLLTAAHKSLPFGTYVLVSNPKNNKQIIVKINDRGPFVSGRELDLSQMAAKYLEITSAGVAPIVYSVLEDKSAITKTVE
ncbi:MAG: septal ring lytic transglycosylase RlpA family protein [Candidatus Caenarcaniphilales bacterium]|jgi:rare lipoprotein A|nr:septal ring lytic transglycosylase RlpA family protein [Candidatus Caenarcaniphilales bacterium]